MATLNAEVRRSKAALRLEIPKLQKLAVKKVRLVCHVLQANPQKLPFKTPLYAVLIEC